MKKIVTSAALLLATAASFAQTTATDWTAPDCSSTSHNLFTELNSGKVIVFVWVMPCGTCVLPAQTAYNTVQNFATSNPGKVVYYLADDLGDAGCTALNDFVNNNSVGNTANMTIFSNSGNLINENDFGGSGMPHIIVMGGPNHQIFFNKKGSAANDASGLTTAINQAIGATSVASLNNEISFSVAPNPLTDHVSISYTKAVRKITVTAMNGQVVKEEVYKNGKMNPVVSMPQIANGVYMVKVTDIDNKTGTQQVVKQ